MHTKHVPWEGLQISLRVGLTEDNLRRILLSFAGPLCMCRRVSFNPYDVENNTETNDRNRVNDGVVRIRFDLRSNRNFSQLEQSG